MADPGSRQLARNPVFFLFSTLMCVRQLHAPLSGLLVPVAAFWCLISFRNDLVVCSCGSSSMPPSSRCLLRCTGDCSESSAVR